MIEVGPRVSRPKLWCPAPSAPANDAQDAAHHYSYVREADALLARLAELDPQCAPPPKRCVLVFSPKQTL